MMCRCIVIFALIGLCRGAILSPGGSREEKTREKRESDGQIGSSIAQGTGQQQTLPTVQNHHPPAVQYYYPTYPEYKKNEHGVGYTDPSIVPEQRESTPWFSDATTLSLPFSSRVLVYGARAGAYLLHLLFVILVGAAFTTVICTFTPLCTISFIGFGLSKDEVKQQVEEIARSYITPESVNAATVLVSQAVDKYLELQHRAPDGQTEEETAVYQR